MHPSPLSHRDSEFERATCTQTTQLQVETHAAFAGASTSTRRTIQLPSDGGSVLTSRIRSFSIATTGVPEDRSPSLSLSLSYLFSFPPRAVCPQGDASVVRKRRATRTVGGLEGTNGGCPEGTLTQAPLLSETIVLPRSSSRRFLISWLKMSDTRTRSTERVHPRRITGGGGGEKNETVRRAREGQAARILR